MDLIIVFYCIIRENILTATAINIEVYHSLHFSIKKVKILFELLFSIV
jgi:hypothetical protein